DEQAAFVEPGEQLPAHSSALNAVSAAATTGHELVLGENAVWSAVSGSLSAGHAVVLGITSAVGAHTLFAGWAADLPDVRMLSARAATETQRHCRRSSPDESMAEDRLRATSFSRG